MKNANLNFIVKNAYSRYDIVIAGGCDEAVLYAAEQLQQFIKQATGVQLSVLRQDEMRLNPFALYIENVGNPDLTKLADSVPAYIKDTDGFAIKSDEGNVFIYGGSGRGCIFGVYEFLERLIGVRFIAHDCTYVPQLTQIAFENLDIVIMPEFPLRCYHIGGLKAGDIPFEFHTRLRFSDNFHQKSAKLGGRANMWGRGENVHNIHMYVPIEKYGKTNSEFFCIYDNPFKDEGNGEWHVLDLTSGITPDGKLNTEMPVSVASVVIEELKKDVVANPDIKYFVFEQHDCGPYKYAPNSLGQALVEKYGHSGILVRFCNVVAREVQKWADRELNGRKIFLETFAYSYTINAPLKEQDGKLVPIDNTVIVADNVVIRMAYFANQYYHYFHAKQRKEVKKNMDEWRLICNHFMFWAYDTDCVSYFWYCPTLQNAAKNMQGFKRMGIEYMYIMGSYNSDTDWQCQLKAYIYSKLMWDVNANWRSLTDEYLNIYYGPAAESVKKMMQLFDRHFDFLFSNFDGLECSNRSMYREPDLYGENMLNLAVRYIEDGEQAIQTQDITKQEKEIYLKRLARVKATPVHMRLVKNAQQLIDTAQAGAITQFNELAEVPNHNDVHQTIYNARASRPDSAGRWVPDNASDMRAAMPQGLALKVKNEDKVLKP